MTFGNFILGMILAVIGYLTVWKSEWLFVNFGAIGFAEKYLQTSGGSRLFYKVIGFIVTLVGLLIATDLMDNFMQWTLGGLFGATTMK
jgi:1,4-dihydroxy-2-naphthoate octaprenyltransferase